MLRQCALVTALTALSLCACSSTHSGSASSSSPSSSPASSSSAASRAAAPQESAKPDPPAGDSIAALREEASAVMDALKKKDAKAAAAFCRPKMRDAFQQFIEESFKEDGGRPDAYKNWNGKLGEIRVKDKAARVQIGEWANGPRTIYLLFWLKDGTWSLGDIPLDPKSEWDKWGQVAN